MNREAALAQAFLNAAKRDIPWKRTVRFSLAERTYALRRLSQRGATYQPK